MNINQRAAFARVAIEQDKLARKKVKKVKAPKKKSGPSTPYKQNR